MTPFESLQKDIQDCISNYPTKELTSGMNGYPEPYGGVLLIAEDAEQAKTLNTVSRQFNERLKNLIQDYEEKQFELEEKGQDTDGIDEIIERLSKVEISPCQAEWKDGWGYANYYDLYEIETQPRHRAIDYVLVKEPSDLKYVRNLKEVAEELDIRENLQKLAEENEVEEIDVITEGLYGYELNFFGVVIEHGNFDRNETEIDWYESEIEAQRWLDEEIVDCPIDYDNKNFAVGLRIFGFTADLYDRMVMGGGMAKHEETVPTGLNTPHYKF